MEIQIDKGQNTMPKGYFDMRYTISVLLVSIIILSVGCSGQKQIDIDTAKMSMQDAIKILENTNSVNGYSHGDTESFLAFEFICKFSNADNVFSALLEKAENPEGKLWALLGLRKTNKKLLKKYCNEIDTSISVCYMIQDVKCKDTINNLLPIIKNGYLLGQIEASDMRENPWWSRVRK